MEENKIVIKEDDFEFTPEAVEELTNGKGDDEDE